MNTSLQFNDENALNFKYCSSATLIKPHKEKQPVTLPVIYIPELPITS